MAEKIDRGRVIDWLDDVILGNTRPDDKAMALQTRKLVLDLPAPSAQDLTGPMPWRLRIASDCLAQMSPAITDAITVEEATTMALKYADALIAAAQEGKEDR